MLIALIAVSSVITVAVLWKQLRNGGLPWGRGALFVVAVGWASQLPTVVSKLSGSVTYKRNIMGNLVESSTPPPGIAVAGCNLLVITLAAVLLWRAIDNAALRRFSIFGVAAMLTLGLSMLIEPAAYMNFLTGQPIVLMGLLAASAFGATSQQGAISGGAVFALSFCAVGGALAVIDPADVFMQCGEKCTVAGEIYTAASTHGNTLGLIAAVGLPFCWLAFKGRARWWTVAYMAANLSLSGSRSAMIAGALTVVALLLTNPTRENGVVRGRNLSLLTAASLASIAVALVLPFTKQPDMFATGRGYLWRLALAQFERTPVLGDGLTSWNRFYTSGQFGAAAAYSTHNQWVEMLLLGGIVGCALFLGGFLAMIFSGSSTRKYQILPILLPVCILGISERPLSLGVTNSMTWVLVALVILSAAPIRATLRDPSPSPHSRSSTHRPVSREATKARMSKTAPIG